MHKNNVIHTGKSVIQLGGVKRYFFEISLDISSNNMLQGIQDSSILDQIEEDEIKQPIARKVLSDRNIYYSRPMPVCNGLPVLFDLGEAIIGKQNNKGDIMPGIYRAPEVILDMNWDTKVDIWSIGTMVSLNICMRLPCFCQY